jgi:AraC family transcriptional regulator
MDAGYDAPDAFVRAFSATVRAIAFVKTFTQDDVTIRDVAPTPVAIMEHRGGPATIGDTLQRFIAWRKAAGLHPRQVRPSMSGVPSGVPRHRPICVGTEQS